MATKYRTIDACVAGEAVRLIVDGAPTVRGRRMPEKYAWLKRHGEHLRRTLMLEPRGHSGMHGALFTEPSASTAHAGLLLMHAGGFPAVSGEAAIAAVKIGIDEKILHVASDKVQIEMPGGIVAVEPRHPSTESSEPSASSVVRSSLFTAAVVSGIAGTVHAAGLTVKFGSRVLPVDIAWGGELFAIVDGESAGVPVDVDHMTDMIRSAVKLMASIDMPQLEGVVFTAPGQQGGHLRSATVTADGVFRRSPGVTTTIAVMAILEAMGILDPDQRFTNESVLGTRVHGAVAQRMVADDRPAIVPEIEAPVTITGRHEFVVEDDYGYSAEAT